MRIARLALPFGAAVLLLIGAVADAATTYSDAISGFEYWATSTDGYFTGTASGDLPGSFTTHVVHSPLTTTPATITGGSFTLYTAIAGSATTVSGTFASGTVAQIDQNTHGCRDQHFAVTGTLANVGVDGTGTGTGTFAATLTHYRTRINGECVTYFATITGSVSLTF
jgi:hypothetical protein